MCPGPINSSPHSADTTQLCIILRILAFPYSLVLFKQALLSPCPTIVPSLAHRPPKALLPICLAYRAVPTPLLILRSLPPLLLSVPMDFRSPCTGHNLAHQGPRSDTPPARNSRPLSSGSAYAGLARPTPAAPGSRPLRHRSAPVGSHYSPARGGCGGAARGLAPGPARPMRSAAAQRAGHGGGAALRGPHRGGSGSGGGSATRGPEAAQGRSQSAAKTGCSLSPALSGTRLQPDPSRLLRRRRPQVLP